MTELSGQYRRLLFVGTGRCGTRWLATSLCNMGLPCYHEGIFNSSSQNTYRVDWLAEASWLAPAYFPLAFRSVYIVHITRDPQDYVTSRMRQQSFTPERMKRGIPQHLPWAVSVVPEIARGRDQEFDYCVRHWYYWNRLIENRMMVNEQVQIERVSNDDFHRWADIIGYVHPLTRGPLERDPNDVGLRVRGRRKQAPKQPGLRQWQQTGMLSVVNNMARRYGYAPIGRDQ